ncbi:homoserine O-acetyltransferase MetX [Taibaiella soli]|uniref:Homoserine O-acetyltransferase n=1 Tax=Taibaiella soli TaxID=1649169 RepID=A0A2W2AA74_9BACT|nr:homoserine O-acetyltransferase [Taibaiella soli]PZF72295.1 homoserine O-acetyltransferase [Taibaiella soli]
MTESFSYNQPFPLECGTVLPSLKIAYCTYGALNAEKNNAIWVCHALTANADVADWWPGMIGAGCAIDPAEHFIICANILGSAYGSTGPLDVNPITKQAYLHSFPTITIRDMVRAHDLLRKELGIEKIKLLVGGSMGGYQAMEWAVMNPDLAERLFLLATSPAESAWGIAIHTAQRLAIEADVSWNANTPEAGSKGLKAARAIGMLTYRNYELMVAQQTDEDNEKIEDFKASSYINYQGDKLTKRFNAYSYWYLTKAMDSHNIARGRKQSIEGVLQTIKTPTLLIGISSDILCPVQEQKFIAAHLPNCRLEIIDSSYGHDGFLVEAEKISVKLREWLTW